MIEVYLPGNSNFTANGDFTLFPSEASTESELGGTWSASLTHPIDPEGRWSYIQEEGVIRMPSWNGSQLYRIKKVTKEQYEVTAEMYPIFYDSADEVFLLDARPTQVDAQAALNLLTAGTRYSGESDIDIVTTAYYQDMNLLEALNGDNDNAFIKRWGGEIVFDNYTVKINQRTGSDQGVRVQYGKNILEDGIRQQVNTSGIITRIFPRAFNGRALSSGGGYVDSYYIAAYPTVKCAAVEYPNIVLAADAGSAALEDPTITVCQDQGQLDAALIAAARADFDVNQIDLPAVSVDIDMAIVADTAEYKQIAGINLEPVSLGDTVKVYYEKLGLDLTERVTAITYDSAADRIGSVKLGPISEDFFARLNTTVQKVNKSINSDGSVKAEQLAGLVSGYTNIKSIQAEIASGVTASRLGDMVTLQLSLDLQQAATMTLQAWSIPAGFRPDANSTFFIGGKNASNLPTAAALLNLLTNGDVYITPKDSSAYTYQDAVTYHTDDAQPAG